MSKPEPLTKPSTHTSHQSFFSEERVARLQRRKISLERALASCSTEADRKLLMGEIEQTVLIIERLLKGAHAE